MKDYCPGIPKRVIFLLIAAVFFVSQYAIAKDNTAPQYGGVMKVVDMAEGSQPLGVPWENTTIDTKLLSPIIETIVREEASGKIHPLLATSWDIDLEAKTMTFKLRQGVKFHDGTDFNAQAVKFCWDKGIEAKIAPGWESVDVVDDYTVRVNFKDYQNTFLSRAASRSMGMISPTAFQKNGIEWARDNPVATGPFKLESFQKGNILKFVKNENYWQKGRPYLDGIHYPFIRDPMTQQAAMRTNDVEQRVDVLSVTSGETAAMMRSMGFEVITMPIGPVSLIPDSANADSPLSNRKVREAIAYAIDREGIVKARGFGIWQPAYQFQPDIMPTYIPDLPKRMYNPEKAKQLLAEAGYPNGFKISINVMPAMVDRDTMVVVQQNLSKVGITVELNFPDMGGYMHARFNGWSNGFMAQHTRALSNFNNTFSIYFLPAFKQFPSLKRAEGLIEMVEASNRTPEPASKEGQAMERLLWEDVMVIPLYYVYETYIMRPTVHDTGYTKWGGSTIYIPEDAWLSKK